MPAEDFFVTMYLRMSENFFSRESATFILPICQKYFLIQVECIHIPEADESILQYHFTVLDNIKTGEKLSLMEMLH